MSLEQRVKALEVAFSDLAAQQRELQATMLEHEQNDDKRMTNMSRDTMREVRNLSGRIQENYNRIQQLREDTFGTSSD